MKSDNPVIQFKNLELMFEDTRDKTILKQPIEPGVNSASLEVEETCKYLDSSQLNR